MRHKGAKPAAQPRSLRGVAEQHSEPGNFPDSVPEDRRDYRDGAEPGQVAHATPGGQVANPKPLRK